MVRGSMLKSRLALSACLAVAAVAGAAVSRTDLLLSHGFGRALENSRPVLSFEPSGGQTDATVGDEGYWLTRAEVESPAPFAKPLAVGDRITIAGRDGRERHLEVADLKAVGGTLLRAGSPRLLLVTCRVLDASAQEARPVRFIVEAEPAEPPAPAPAKAL